jgi:uncharacterized protein with von Willebrand factor type A (vWA) domain
VLASSQRDLVIFDALFDEFWRSRGAQQGAGSLGRSQVRVTRAPNAESRAAAVSLESWMRKSDADDDVLPLRRASAHDRSAAHDLTALAAGEGDEIERIARRIARRLALRPSRRWRVRRRGPRIDLRRTMRWLLRTGGDAALLARRDRIVRRTRLVVLCDVSGSMEMYARLLLRFIHALQNAFARVETFAFSTRLTRVTPMFKGASYPQALAAVGHGVRDFSGGTKIGESLFAFLERWPNAIDARTVVLVMSDGWDTGEPAVLDAALQRIARRAGRVIWLNPLMGSPDFAPETRAMRTALPHIDVLASAHNVASLQALARHLVL